MDPCIDAGETDMHCSLCFGCNLRIGGSGSFHCQERCTRGGCGWSIEWGVGKHTPYDTIGNLASTDSNGIVVDAWLPSWRSRSTLAYNA